MKTTTLLAAFSLLMLTCFSCGGKKNPSAQTPIQDSAAESAAIEAQEPDSTIYGTSGEDFGMSTFNMISDKGDTLYLCRTAEDGTDGKIYGSLKYGERYALTTRDHGQAVGVLINLTELDKKLKDYTIKNGHIIVKGDTIDAKKLFQ